jgi:hypothetical protein
MIFTHLVLFHFFTGAGGTAAANHPRRPLLGVGV